MFRVVSCIARKVRGKAQAHKRIDGAKRLHVLLEHSVAAKAGGEFLMTDCRKLGPQAARRGIGLTAAK
jgi:hypothetical protein